MEPITFLGISFRSASHFHWFLLSMTLFTLSCLWYLCAHLLGRRRQVSDLFASALWRVFAWFHGSTVFNASVWVIASLLRGRSPDGPVYSTDCIWFNALMCAIYFLLWRFVPKLRHDAKAPV